MYYNYCKQFRKQKLAKKRQLNLILSQLDSFKCSYAYTDEGGEMEMSSSIKFEFKFIFKQKISLVFKPAFTKVLPLVGGLV